MNKNIVIAIVIILILAVLGLGFWYWQTQRAEIAPTTPAPEEPTTGDTTGAINQELESVDVNGLDPNFKEIDAELENL